MTPGASLDERLNYSVVGTTHLRRLHSDLAYFKESLIIWMIASD